MSFAAALSVSGAPVQHLPKRWQRWRGTCATAVAQGTHSSTPRPLSVPLLVTAHGCATQSGRGGSCPAQDGFRSRLPLCSFWSDFRTAVGLPGGDGVFHICLTGQGLPCCSHQSTWQERFFPEAIVTTDWDSLNISTPSAIYLEHIFARVRDLGKTHYSFYRCFFVQAALAGAPAVPPCRLSPAMARSSSAPCRPGCSRPGLGAAPAGSAALPSHGIPPAGGTALPSHQIPPAGNPSSSFSSNSS